MKPVLLSLLASLLTFFAVAQELKTEKKTLSRHLKEVYEVEKADKKIRNGSYVVLNDANRQLVRGTYKSDKKAGIWTYFNGAGDTVQRYDFGLDSLLLDVADSNSLIHSDFQIPQGAEDSDKVRPPYKIGGVEYGFYLLFDDRDIPAEVKSSSDQAQMTYILTISEKGELEGWTIVFAGKNINDIVIRKSLRGLPADAYEFAAATINGHRVRSKLTYWVPLNVNHVDVPGTNNIATPPKTQ
jgi:hypothetical protein